MRNGKKSSYKPEFNSRKESDCVYVCETVVLKIKFVKC